VKIVGGQGVKIVGGQGVKIVGGQGVIRKYKDNFKFIKQTF